MFSPKTFDLIFLLVNNVLLFLKFGSSSNWLFVGEGGSHTTGAGLLFLNRRLNLLAGFSLLKLFVPTSPRKLLRRICLLLNVLTVWVPCSVKYLRWQCWAQLKLDLMTPLISLLMEPLLYVPLVISCVHRCASLERLTLDALFFYKRYTKFLNCFLLVGTHINPCFYLV